MGAGRLVMRRHVCLALLTDAYGGQGGIAQYNRDLTAALARVPSLAAIEILPRVAPVPAGVLPAEVKQHPPRSGRLAYVVAALGLAARFKPDVIFCGHLFMAPLGLALAKLFTARLIVQAHGVEAWTRPRKLQRLAVEQADLILAVSRDTRARVLDWANIEPERVRVASNTVGEEFTPGDGDAARDSLGLAEEFVILTVGRLAAAERYKGHDRLIPLLKSLNGSTTAPIYLIAGAGDDQLRLEALAVRHGVGAQVRFLGHVPQDRLPNLYRAAHLFILPSSGEGFGIVLLEAMACGTPAMGLAHSGVLDALCDGELGAVVEEADLLARLQQACCDRRAGRLEAGHMLARRVGERFGRAAFERRIGGLLAGLLD
jgi:phosphatidylinositol alpha-1,6-mannosyltransferase